jgi:hypothetical protein
MFLNIGLAYLRTMGKYGPLMKNGKMKHILLKWLVML